MLGIHNAPPRLKLLALEKPAHVSKIQKQGARIFGVSTTPGHPPLREKLRPQTKGCCGDSSCFSSSRWEALPEPIHRPRWCWCDSAHSCDPASCHRCCSKRAHTTEQCHTHTREERESASATPSSSGPTKKKHGRPNPSSEDIDSTWGCACVSSLPLRGGDPRFDSSTSATRPPSADIVARSTRQVSCKIKHGLGHNEEGESTSEHERNILSHSSRTFGRASTMSCPRGMSRNWR